MNELEIIPVPVHSFYSIVVKRFFDIALSGMALIVLSPLLIITAILELIYQGWPILYATKRPGKNGKIISIYKFRSMTNERGKDGLLLDDNLRITKFGRIIRKLSIDELPELWSIFKGDMSIIGPRPLLIEYLELYPKRYATRQSVRPGLTCLRINNNTSSKTWTWREQFENDIFYIEHISFKTDILMIFAVIKEVLHGSEYRADAMRVPFDGTNLDETRSVAEVDTIKRYDSISK